ncbi:hypothetical protein DU508_15630 [Pedobacter chinensis]|uniref:HEAT repeat domain-containing protein n=1 Tax=Pedobacter chinensis TaxID=2282421 RepID=A0A369PYD8_9SPHI|nr:hypothetical protein [Pedobacter chinensis]RDC55699.1 hypothetical protein DU508_15630 [Pedobacter chinensis]
MQPLLDTIKATLSKSKVEKLAAIASDETFSVKDLIDLSFHHDEQIGFRSAWILENVYSHHQERFLPYVHYFLERFSTQNNLSALRHYVKILAFMTGKNAPSEIKEIISDCDTDKIVEVVFAWLIDEKIPVAVKSHCLNILANLIPKHGWIKDELIQTMNFLIDKESIAFFARVKQIRKQLSVSSSSFSVS